MNIYNDFKNQIFEIFLKVTKDNNKSLDDIHTLKEKFTVELPREESHGDISTNICLVLSKIVGFKPKELAILMKSNLEKLDCFNDISIEGPGFININLENSFWHEQILKILKLKSKFGRSEIFLNNNINVEFVSANPTGPLHVGHVRGAVIGDVLSNILNMVGYNVTKEYYINDAGNQIDVLAGSVFIRYEELITKNKAEIPEGYYPGAVSYTHLTLPTKA